MPRENPPQRRCTYRKACSVKRFTATEKWSDSWFRKLKPDHKNLWQYIVDNCDVAGVWKVDLELAAYYIGNEKPFNASEVLKAFAGRLVDIGRGRWWYPGLIPFQYGQLSEKCDFHKTIIKKLQSHGLMARWEAYLADRAASDAAAELPISDVPPTLPPPLPHEGEPASLKKEREEEEKEILGKGYGENRNGAPSQAVEFPKGFPTNETTAIDWARVGGCRATDEQIRLYWNEAAARNGTDVTGQPITRWVQHCSARAIRTEGRTAEAKANGNGSVWSQQKQLEAVLVEMKKIERRGHEDPAAGLVIKQEDRAGYRLLKKRRDELNASIAKGG